MEGDGLVELIEAEDKRKKQVLLTDKGIQLAEQTVDVVAVLETEAMGALSPSERTVFIELLRKYTDFLKIKLRTFSGKQKN